MKKIFIFLLFATLSINAFSQNAFRLGIQASPTFSWMNTNQNTITGDGLRLGLEIGLMGDYFFSDDNRYSFSTGASLLLNQGGSLVYTTGGNLFPDSELSQDTLSNIDNGIKIGYSFQYIEVPFSVKLRTEPTNNLAYYVQIPYFSLGFPIQGRADFEGVSENENIYKSVIPLSFTWGLGAGVEYELKSAKVTGGLTFQNSILDVIEDKGVLNTGEKEDAKQTLNRVTLRLGIFF